MNADGKGMRKGSPQGKGKSGGCMPTGNGIYKVFGDKRRFKQVIINLLKNAIKFTNEGTIQIKVCYRFGPPNLLIVHIKDTGVGIH